MPSEDRTTRALAALAAPRESFHAAVAAAVDQVRALVDANRAPAAGPAARAADGLGAFAAGRIDAERFAGLFAGERVLDDRALDGMEAALAVLTETAAAADDAYRVDVPSGGSLGVEVDRVLAHLGRAFAAARAVERARTGGAAGEDPAAPWPFARWNRAERAIAPPLVVEVDGADLAAGGLAAFLDGGQKLVLVVRGPAAPAPLVGMITPGTLVLQATSPAALGQLDGWDGPAVAALLPAGAAEFAHRPLAGQTLRERLAVTALPDAAPVRWLGGRSPWQQGQELAQLRSLAAEGVAPQQAPAEPDQDVQPTDRLAAWLLRQTHLPDVA
ncbi:MAG: hypothetical protein WEA24_02395 [Gemmatimonadota bacterium]